MTNYTQTNIYRRQMKDLGLNTEQYAKLIDMPYEVVKDMIYDKEGDYSMEIKNILRKNMFNKHQEIENDIENAKFKALEIKRNNDEIDYIKWYENEYNVEMLKEKLNLDTIKKFENNYYLTIFGKKASHWFYTILCAKREYKDHSIELSKKTEFVKQLYDIIVNDNADKYKSTQNKDEINTNELIEWYKSFDFDEFRKKYNLSNYKIAKDLHISYSTMCQLCTNKYISIRLITKFHDYFVLKLDKEEIEGNDRIQILNWFKNFDFKKYFKENNITRQDFCNQLGILYGRLNKMLSNQKNSSYVTDNIEKIYNYINNNETIVDNKETLQNDLYKKEEIDVDNDKNNMIVAEFEEDDNNTTMKFVEQSEQETYKEPKIELVNTNDDILRKILINRLTDEEKELIRIFGGKIC